MNIEDQVGQNPKLAIVFERSCWDVFWDSKAPTNYDHQKWSDSKFHPFGPNTYGTHDGSQGFPGMGYVMLWSTQVGPQAVFDGVSEKEGPFFQLG